MDHGDAEGGVRHAEGVVEILRQQDGLLALGETLVGVSGQPLVGAEVGERADAGVDDAVAPGAPPLLVFVVERNRAAEIAIGRGELAAVEGSDPGGIQRLQDQRAIPRGIGQSAHGLDELGRGIVCAARRVVEPGPAERRELLAHVAAHVGAGESARPGVRARHVGAGVALRGHERGAQRDLDGALALIPLRPGGQAFEERQRAAEVPPGLEVRRALERALAGAESSSRARRGAEPASVKWCAKSSGWVSTTEGKCCSSARATS